MEKQRYLTKYIIEDIKEKMVFIGGARQVGKTTLALKLIAPFFKNYTYYNWDNRQDRRKIINGEIPGSAGLIIYDEIHKYKKWKNLIKGEYDKYRDKFKFLVTGSARLDIYRKGGDSLQGRYHYYRMHPFSMAEILNKNNKIRVLKELDIDNKNYFNEFDILEKFGGFPEVLFNQNERILRRWHNEKNERLFREDIRDLKLIKDIGNMKLLSDILPGRIGSLLSINSIREDLEVSHRAVSSWLDILELFYYHFRIYPYHKKKIRSIKKEPKLYLFDWSEVEEESARFENMIASHLIKLTHFLNDYEGYKAELFFLRNVDKREVDFLVCIDDRPWFCVETKLSDEKVSDSLHYFINRLKIPFVYQVIKKKNIDKIVNGIRIVSADRFLCSLI
ncbi:MAG: ATP-binding protein [Spirochaetes bacterium]|nr:ATP-binding protein [Spirochaetota bacterium]